MRMTRTTKMQRIKTAIEEILLDKEWEVDDYKLELFNMLQVMQDPDRLAMACIHRKTNLITLSMHPQIEQKLEEIIDVTGVKKYFHDALLQLTRGLTLHEWGHWQGCPMEDKIAMEMAAEASPSVYEYLRKYKEKQKTRETGDLHPDIEIDKKELMMHTFHQTNYFADLIDDTLEAHLDENKEDYVLGNWLFYIIEGEANKKSAKKRCEAQRMLAKQVISTIKETREKIKQKQAEVEELEKEIEEHSYEFGLHDKREELRTLQNKEIYNLEYLAEIRQKRQEISKGKLSKHFTLFLNTAAKLYLDKEKEKYWQEYYAEDFEELEEETQNILEILVDDHETARKIADRTATKQDWKKALHEIEYKYNKWADKNKKVVEIFLKYLDPEEQPKGTGMNMFFQNFIDNPEDMEEAIENLVKKGKPLHLADKDTVYNAIYRQKAQDIVMEEIRQDKEEGRLKIKDISLKKTTIPSLSGIKWSKTKVKYVDGEPQFEFYKEEVPLEIPGSFPKITRGLPDMLFMVDTSGSMGWAYAENNGNIDTSREMADYDLACTSIHSVVNYLEKSKKAPWMKFGAVTFSDETKFSGWKEHKDIDEMFKTLYDKEDGCTQLDTKVIDEVLKSKSDNFWAIMVTDGALHNEAEALKKIQEMVEQGNYFTLIHIKGAYSGGESFCKKIKELYGEDAAVIIKSAEDLAGVSLKYTKHMYGAIR